MKEQNEDKFVVFLPMEFEKGSDSAEDRYANMRLKGVASTIHSGRDSDGEILETSGMDVRDLTSLGFINWHHLWTKDPSMIIGEPTKAEIKDGNLHIEGKLYSDSQKARDAYDLAEVLDKNSATRKLGWSIEGKALERDPKDKKRILKSRITGVALTPAPKNKGTKAELLKGQLEDFFKAETDDQGNITEYLIDSTDSNGVRRTVDKNLHIKVWDISKAMEAGQTTGRDTTNQDLTQQPLKEESVEGTKKKKKKDKNKVLSKGELAFEILRIFKTDDPIIIKGIVELVTQINMTPTAEDIQKAKEILGLAKAGEINKAEKMTVEKAEVLKAEYKEAIAKAKEYMEKAEAAKVQLEEAGHKMGDTNGDDSEILSHKKAETNDLNKATDNKDKNEESALVKAMNEKFTSLSTLIVAKENENTELKKALEDLAVKVEQIGKTAPNAKSITASYKERFPKTEGGETVMSMKTDRRAITNELVKAAKIGTADQDDIFFKAASCMETTGSFGTTAEEINLVARRIKERLKIQIIA